MQKQIILQSVEISFVTGVRKKYMLGGVFTVSWMTVSGV